MGSSPLRVHCDFETFSAGPEVKWAGPVRYAEHPSTEVLCLGWAIGDEEPRLWKPGDAFPKRLFAAIRDGALLYAWNAEFELPVWARHCRDRMGWPNVPLDQWRDTAAVALSLGFPAKLEDAGRALRLAVQKDQRGKYLLTKLAKPRRPSKANPATRWTPLTAPEDFAALYEYCRQDVAAERAIHRALPRQDLPPGELEIWRATVRMNLRGWAVDDESARRILEILAVHRAQALEELSELTGGRLTSDGQRERALAWLAEQGLDLPDWTKDTIATALRRTDLPAKCRRLLELRRTLGKSSIKKYEAMRLRQCADGTVKNNVLYHGASTGRDAGRGLQIQNFPRDSVGKKEEAVERAFRVLHLPDAAEAVEVLYGSPPDLAARLLRPHMIARPGHALFWADLASIENRFTVWYAEDQKGIQLFRDGRDQYREFAMGHYGVARDQVSEEQRQHSKAIVLGCGFGMGWPKFMATCANQGRPITEKVAQESVKSYREQYAAVVELWHGLNKAAILAVRENVPTKYLKVRFRVVGDFLYMRLASGRDLAYHLPRVEMATMPWVDSDGEPVRRAAVTVMGVGNQPGTWVRAAVAPGRWAENAVQATARDVLMLGAAAAEEAGYHVVGRVHDELVTERPLGEGSAQELVALMTRQPAWMPDRAPAEGSGPDMPLAAEGWGPHRRYRKA